MVDVCATNLCQVDSGLARSPGWPAHVLGSGLERAASSRPPLLRRVSA